ncbi:MAG TPA: DUF192 domain-containing protein [Candidatus Cloacimonadota bacterium]|nr:DUF192 domain-containing protein [Candidatus Cloacimonadota bacterium]
MRISVISLILALAIISVMACKRENPKPPAEEKPKYSFRHDGFLEVRSSDGKYKTTIDIEIVEKETEILQGLKYRDKMDKNQGMLFIFEEVYYHDFWMQDTYMSLDMLFIDQNDEIFQIVKNTTPFSEERISPTKPNRYVLELVAGAADYHGIEETDRVIWYRKKN